MIASHNDNDLALLAKFKTLINRRDEGAVTLLYDNYYDKLLHFAQTFIASTEAGEEIVDDMIIKLWSSPGLVANIDNLPVYLYKSVKNGCLSYLRKQHQVFSIDFSTTTHSLELSSPNALEALVFSEMSQAFQVAVDSLPPRCRLIFTLIREDGLAYKEVAEILSISVNTIDSQMAIAIKRICASLGIDKNTAKGRYQNLS